MEQKVYDIENLDCANCAAKIEAKFNALAEVKDATITFATRQLRLTAENPDALIEKLTAIARTVESEVLIRPRNHARHEHHHEIQMPAATPFVFVVIPYFSALKKRIYLWKSLTFGRFLYIIIVSYYKECKLWEPLFFGSFSG